MDIASGVPWLLRSAIRRLGQTSTIAVVIALLLISLIFGSALVAMVESVVGGTGPRSFFDALWWFVVTITGVGLDAVAPVTQLGRASSASVLMLARIFFGMFTAAIASFMINRLLMEGKGMGDVVLRGHCVICGWNKRGEEIVRQLTSDEVTQDIVILAELENTPIRHNKVQFVHGDPAKEKDLQRAAVGRAMSVIILSDEAAPGLSDSTVDARSVLVALAVQKMNPQAYTLAEVRQGENRRHFENASVDEIIVVNEIVSDLMARASVLHGLTSVVTGLLTRDNKSDIYVVPAPTSLIGKTFLDVMIQLQSKHSAIAFGVKRDGAMLLNPLDSLVITEGDNLALIARENVVLA